MLTTEPRLIPDTLDEQAADFLTGHRGALATSRGTRVEHRKAKPLPVLGLFAYLSALPFSLSTRYTGPRLSRSARWQAVSMAVQLLPELLLP